MPELSKRLHHCFKSVFADLTPEQIERASPASVPDWDSLGAVNLAAVVEEEFRISIPAEDFESLKSYAIILKYLESKFDGSRA